MAEGDLIVDDFQYEYNNLLLGAYTPYELQNLSGLNSLANVRSGSADRFGQHGGVGGRHYLGIKNLAATFDIYNPGDTEEQFAQRRDALAMAFAVIEDPNDALPLVFKHPGHDKMRVYCRPIDRTIPTDLMFSLGVGVAAIRLEQVDPFTYSNILRSVTASTGTTTGGLSFPMDFPLVFGAGSSGGSQSVNNGGTAPAPWTATITGETPNPKITHVESGRFIELTGITVASGETLEFDSMERSILLNGTSSRRGLMTPASSWFALQPGVNTIQFSSGGVATGQLTFRWRDTYWSD